MHSKSSLLCPRVGHLINKREGDVCQDKKKNSVLMREARTLLQLIVRHRTQSEFATVDQGDCAPTELQCVLVLLLGKRSNAADVYAFLLDATSKPICIYRRFGSQREGKHKSNNDLQTLSDRQYMICCTSQFLPVDHIGMEQFWISKT